MPLAYYKMFPDFDDKTEMLTDSEYRRLVHAINVYVQTGEVIEMPGNERILFPVFKIQIDRDKEDYDKVSEARARAGAKGARATNSQQKAAKPANADNSRQMPSNASNSPQEKEKEKEKEEDIYSCSSNSDHVRYIKAFEANIGLYPHPASSNGRNLEQYYDDFGADVMIEAIEQTNRKQPTSPIPFLIAILQEWTKAGVKTVDEARAANLDHERKTQRLKGAGQYGTGTKRPEPPPRIIGGEIVL